MVVEHAWRWLRISLIVSCAWCVLAVGGMVRAADPASEYLSDGLIDEMTTAQDWGGLGLDTAVKPAGRPAMKLRIKDKEYQHGLGHHANGQISVLLDGQYQMFDCEVGVQQQEGSGGGSVVFQVYVDDKPVFDSGVMRQSDPPRKVSVSVRDADVLRLVAKDAGDGIACDCADWADARLTPNPKAKALAAQTAVDIAPFARVVTSDPQRMAGTAAKRTQEMPAADVFLETDLLPTADGSYCAPVTAAGQASLGLRWDEMRLLRRLTLQWPAGKAPSPTTVQLQYWVGESPWQGGWKPLPAAFAAEKNAWTWTVASKDQPAGTVRVRWVFADVKEPLVVRGLHVQSRSRWQDARLRAELQNPAAGQKVPVTLYNGAWLAEGATSSAAAPTRSWTAAEPLAVAVRYSRARPYKADRTVLRFALPKQTISVAVEDVVARGCVYVPSAGLFVTVDPPQTTLAQYVQQIAGQKTVLEDVRQQPDQTLAQAMAKTHNPVQNHGPTLLSLACDNRKFQVNENGAVRFDRYDAPDGHCQLFVWPQTSLTKPCPELTPQFGAGQGQASRNLDGGWLPIIVNTVTENGVRYRQRSYVAPLDAQSPADGPAWYRQRAVCVLDYTLENTGAAEAEVALKLNLMDAGQPIPAERLQAVEGGLLAVDGDRVLAYFDGRTAAPLQLAKTGQGGAIAGKLAGGKTVRLTVYLPAWLVKPADYAVLRDKGRWLAETRKYWDAQLADAVQIDVPDALLTDVIRASQVHCLLAARNEDHERHISPWISSPSYGPLESEGQAVIRGMDMCGHGAFARSALEFYLKRYNAQGYLTTGYTMIGTGEHLWTLAEYVERSGDREWLQRAAPALVRACRWIVAQRAKTKGVDGHGAKSPEYGLMPPGVSADWNRYAYRFFNDVQYCHGLEAAAQALAKSGHPDAPALLADAAAYRADLLRAYRWTQARCPVVALANGTWTPNHPAMLDVFGNVEEFVPAEDANRSWCYSVEIGGHHLAANGLLDPQSAEVAQIMDYLEDHQFLRDGWFDYPEEQNRKDVFNLGGFAKVQPYYARNAEICALRDDVKPFIRAYFNALSTLLNAENLSLWEHFHNRGAWNKTHETGWFLCQTALMFAMARDNELWLAPFTTNRWLEDGRKIAVRNEPTPFGPVSYTITSAAATGHIAAEVTPPQRETPARLVIRIRHPEGRPMRAVTVNGKPHTAFDAQKECVFLPAGKQRISLRVDY